MAVTGRYRVSLEHSGHTNASSRCLSDDVAILLFALPDIQTLHVTRVGPKYLINDTHTHTHTKRLLYHNEAEQYKRLPRVRACEQMVCWQFPKSYWVVNDLKFLGLAVPDGGPANEKARSLNSACYTSCCWRNDITHGRYKMSYDTILCI